MRTRALLLLLCWGSIALALAGSNRPQRPGVGHPLRANHAIAPELRMRTAGLQSALRSTNSKGYNPWVEQVTGLPTNAVPWAVHAVDNEVVWALVGRPEGGTGGVARWVIRTTDAGADWIRDTIATSPSTAGTSGICAHDANTAWVTMIGLVEGSGGAVFRTTDSGVTWIEDSTAFKTSGGFANFIHFFDANNGVCMGDPTDDYFEIYTTSDGGATWSRVPIANFPPHLLANMGSISLFFAAGNSLWFPTGIFGEGYRTGKYYRTTDRGLTWSEHVFPGVGPGYVPFLDFRTRMSGWAAVLGGR